MTLVRLERPSDDLTHIVDGRIVKQGKRVVLAARLRELRKGRVVGRFETAPRRLTQVDRSAPQLAKKLAQALARPVEPEPRPRPVVRGTPRAPGLLVLRTGGSTFAGQDPWAESFAQRAGYRVLRSERRGKRVGGCGAGGNA